MDNQILIYSTDNFRQNRKKRFANHQVAGYACQVGFSPDGRWISSGDGSGNVVFWDWKTGNIKSRLKTHSQVVISHVWLPHETVSTGRDPASADTNCRDQSKVITASWDGLIKLWVRHWSPHFYWARYLTAICIGLRNRWEGCAQGRGDRLPVVYFCVGMMSLLPIHYYIRRA